MLNTLVVLGWIQITNGIKCKKLGYPGIFLYDVQEMTDVLENDRLEKSVYIGKNNLK